MKRIINYRRASGEEPFSEWLETLRDKTALAKIRAYIDRLALGYSRKNVEWVGGGVFELKINFGPGFRVYFGERGQELIVLLIGGTKRRQERDIDLAKTFWRDYNAKT